MIPFLITIEGIAPDEDTMHEMFANVRPDRNKIVEGLTKAGATQITARSTHARRKKVADVAVGSGVDVTPSPAVVTEIPAASEPENSADDPNAPPWSPRPPTTSRRPNVRAA